MTSPAVVMVVDGLIAVVTTVVGFVVAEVVVVVVVLVSVVAAIISFKLIFHYNIWHLSNSMIDHKIIINFDLSDFRDCQIMQEHYMQNVAFHSKVAL